MRVATWNLEWVKPGTDRHRRAIAQLESIDADIVVTTEHSPHEWAAYPHSVDGGADWGYPIVEGRRKVICWSKEPWTDAAAGGDGALQGRFVDASTSARGTTVRVLGVCIPWRDAHVRTGRRDRELWEDHLEFCQRLKPILDSPVSPTIVAGDFNQRFPRSRQPQHVHDALRTALGELVVHTEGDHDGVGKLIDHVATSNDFARQTMTTWSNVIDGKRLTDHSGVAVEFDRAN